VSQKPRTLSMLMALVAGNESKMHDVQNDPKIGKVVRELRERMGWSIRDLARASRLNKNTILHVEKGLTTKLAVLDQIGDALGVAPPRLAYLAGLSEQRWQVHKRGKGTWSMRLGVRELKNPEKYRDLIQEFGERKRLGELEFASCFIKPLECVLKEGRLLSGMVEIYSRLEVKHSPGETFIYCQTGALNVEVGEDKFSLDEGESMTVLDTGDTAYEPAGLKIPTRFIYVRLSADDRVVAHPPSQPEDVPASEE
jgi:transcriptional regulator with XRE-family HTH domain